jgi:hypothetical protein
MQGEDHARPAHERTQQQVRAAELQRMIVFLRPVTILTDLASAAF